MLEKLKVAAYLDEAGDDPDVACATISKLGIKYVVLRSAWGTSVSASSDKACQTLRTLLTTHGLSAVALISDLGSTDYKTVTQTPIAIIDRTFNIAAYFKVAFLRLMVGTKPIVAPDAIVDDWFQTITERCLINNIVPVLEPTHQSALYDPVMIVKALVKYRRWKLLYDPAQLILQRKLDPFVKYWTLLKNFTAAIDIHDFKIGYGHKPAGFGDAKIKETLADVLATNYKGWFFLEPSLGRRHGSALTKEDTFIMAAKALEALVP